MSSSFSFVWFTPILTFPIRSRSCEGRRAQWPCRCGGHGPRRPGAAGRDPSRGRAHGGRAAQIRSAGAPTTLPPAHANSAGNVYKTTRSNPILHGCQLTKSDQSNPPTPRMPVQFNPNQVSSTPSPPSTDVSSIQPNPNHVSSIQSNPIPSSKDVSSKSVQSNPLRGDRVRTSDCLMRTPIARRLTIPAILGRGSRGRGAGLWDETLEPSTQTRLFPLGEAAYYTIAQRRRRRGGGAGRGGPRRSNTPGSAQCSSAQSLARGGQRYVGNRLAPSVVKKKKK